MNDLNQTNYDRLALEYQALSEVVGILKRRRSLGETLELSLGVIVRVIPQADFGAVMLWDQSSGLFRPWASYGCDPAIFRRIGLQAGESITGRVFDEKKALLLDTLTSLKRLGFERVIISNRKLFVSGKS